MSLRPVDLNSLVTVDRKVCGLGSSRATAADQGTKHRELLLVPKFIVYSLKISAD